MKEWQSPFDSLVIGIDRSEVELGESIRTSEAFRMLMAFPESARTYQERVEFAFRGYDDDLRELWEIDALRERVFAFLKGSASA